MVRKIGNIFLVAFFASLLVLVKSSSGNPIENESLEELKVELKSLRIKVDLLEARNIENVNLLTAKISNHETKISNQEEEIAMLKVKIDSKLEAGHPSGSFEVERYLHLNSDNQMSSTITKKEDISGYSSTRALAPSSCRELSFAGHSLDGLYLVQNVDTKKIETVLCTFGPSVVQEPIGTVDVKTKTVHFYVQRNSSFNTLDAVLPFELARLNEGNAFDLPSGIFTVPVPGIYHFEMSAVKEPIETILDIIIQVNGVDIGRAFTQESATGNYDALSLSASLRLAAGDRVNLFKYLGGVLFDNRVHYTHFTGWLVEEDLM